MQQGRLVRPFRTTDGNVVEVRGESGKIEIQTADFSSAAGRLIGLLNNFPKSETLEAVGLEIEISGKTCDDQQNCHSCHSPADCPFYIHDGTLKCLPDSDVVLQGINSRDRIQITPNVKTYRADRRSVPESKTDRIGVIVNEAGKIYCAIDVAAIVEDHTAQRLVDMKREAQLRIEDKQLPAADGHSHVHTTGLFL